jgi:ABC-type transport system involved in multi-copper enzyme maturation permease subunit
MDLLKVCKAEWTKTLKKPIILSLLVGLLIPLFYGLGVYLEWSFIQISVEEPVPALENAFVMWIVLSFTTIPHFLFVVIAVNNFARELEGGQIRNLIARGISRKKLILSKVIVHAALVIAFYLLFIAVSVAVYYAFVANSYIGSGAFINLADSAVTIASNMINITDILLVSSVAFLIGLYFTPFKSFMLSMAFMFGVMSFEFFPYVKLLSPSYTANLLGYGEMTASTGIVMAFVYLLFAAVPIFFLVRKFNKMDIA